MRLIPSAVVVCIALGGFVPSTAAAGTITVGEFNWDDDGFGLGPQFSIFNYSFTLPFDAGAVLPPAYMGGAFAGIELHLDGAAAALGATELGAENSWTSIPGDFGTVKAVLTFAFLGQPYQIHLSTGCGGVAGCIEIAPPDDITGEQHGGALIQFDTALTPVPEPGTLLATAIGAAWAAALRRRRVNGPL